MKLQTRYEDNVEKHVTHFYDFIGDRLIIGKFCAIAKCVEYQGLTPHVVVIVLVIWH